MAAAAAVKTPWRNAACLMFLTGPFGYCKQPLPIENPLSVSQGPFLKYTSKEEPEPEILFVQRHSKSGFMADVHVFPGGVLDEADYSPKWLDLFTEPKGCEHPFASILSLRHLLPIYKCISQDNPIPGEVGLRICAIREFFEEAGILLARDRDEVSSKANMFPGSFGPAVKEFPDDVMKEWRTRVHNNAYEFITMCRELRCVPDIWSLIEWSDWLTPRNHSRRYDTLFFMCYSGSKPVGAPDLLEVTTMKWMTPSVASEMFRTGNVKLAPPQFAEISGLARQSNVPLLHLFALSKSMQEKGIYCKKSARMLTKDMAVLSVTQEDDLYPAEGSEDWTTPLQHPQSLDLQQHKVSLVLSQKQGFEYEIPTHTVQELDKLSSTTNRMVFHSPSNFRFVDSVESALLSKFLQQVIGESSKL